MPWPSRDVRVATLALLTLTIQSVDRLPACVTGLRSLLRRNAKCLPEVERWYLGAARRKPAGSTRVLLPMQNLSSAVTDVIEGHSRPCRSPQGSWPWWWRWRSLCRRCGCVLMFFGLAALFRGRTYFHWSSRSYGKPGDGHPWIHCCGRAKHH